jgi:hypothetical protein
MRTCTQAGVLPFDADSGSLFTVLGYASVGLGGCERGSGVGCEGKESEG